MYFAISCFSPNDNRIKGFRFWRWSTDRPSLRFWRASNFRSQPRIINQSYVYRNLSCIKCPNGWTKGQKKNANLSKPNIRPMKRDINRNYILVGSYHTKGNWCLSNVPNSVAKKRRSLTFGCVEVFDTKHIGVLECLLSHYLRAKLTTVGLGFIEQLWYFLFNFRKGRITIFELGDFVSQGRARRRWLLHLLIF